MTKDCNNCQHHLQGRTLDDCPAICWDCFDHTQDPLVLRNWTPKVLPPLEFSSQVTERRLNSTTISISAKEKQVGGSHYKDMGVEPWDVVDTWPLDERIGFYRGCGLKYVMRMGSKDERVQEIQKGIHVLEKLVEVLKESVAPKAAPTKGLR